MTPHRLTAALSRLLLETKTPLLPLLGAIAAEMDQLFPEDGALPDGSGCVDVAATDGKRIVWNASWLRTSDIAASVEHLSWILAHEALHVRLHHPARGVGKDMEAWHIACDAVVNRLLKEAGFFPPGIASQCVPPDETGRSEEAIYLSLLGQQQEPQRALFPGEDIGAPGNGTDMLAAERRFANIGRAVGAAKSASGNLPGNGAAGLGLEALAAKPKLRWDALLARFIHDSFRSRGRLTWKRPHRKVLAQHDLVLPSFTKGVATGTLLFIVDTSGSMLGSPLARCWTEVRAAAEMARPERLVLVSCDTEPTLIAEYGPGEELPEGVRLTGDGGTDFAAPLAWAAQQMRSGRMPDVKAIVYLTDTYGNFPEEPPDVPVIWVSTERRDRCWMPPFGELVELPEE
jgi:predicted metal-dependent peptidase